MVEDEWQRHLQECEAPKQSHGPVHTDAVVHGSADEINEAGGKIAAACYYSQRTPGVDAVCIKEVLISGVKTSAPPRCGRRGLASTYTVTYMPAQLKPSSTIAPSPDHGEMDA